MRGKASPHAYEKAKVHLRKHPMPALNLALGVRHMDPKTRMLTQDTQHHSTDVMLIDSVSCCMVEHPPVPLNGRSAFLGTLLLGASRGFEQRTLQAKSRFVYFPSIYGNARRTAQVHAALY